MTVLLAGALLLLDGCATSPTSEVRQAGGRPEAFAAAFDITTGRQLWATSIRPPISGMYAAATDEDHLVVDGFPGAAVYRATWRSLSMTRPEPR
jgi:hypothetical protein